MKLKVTKLKNGDYESDEKFQIEKKRLKSKIENCEKEMEKLPFNGGKMKKNEKEEVGIQANIIKLLAIFTQIKTTRRIRKNLKHQLDEKINQNEIKNNQLLKY